MCFGYCEERVAVMCRMMSGADIELRNNDLRNRYNVLQR